MYYFTHEQMKFVQVCLVTLAGFSGFTSGLLFGKIGSHFQTNCILYANVTVRPVTKQSVDLNVNTRNDYDVFVESDTTWGQPQMCDLVTFEGVLVFVISFIWLWFFINMDSDRDSSCNIDLPLPLKPERHRWPFYAHTPRYGVYTRAAQNHQAREALFVLPPIVLHTVLCFLSVVRVSYATDGYQQFCYSLCDIRNGILCQETADGCRQFQYRQWVFLSTLHTERGRPFAFHDAMKAALVASWLEPLMLATHVLVVMAQTYLDTPASGANSQGARTTTPRIYVHPSPAVRNGASRAKSKKSKSNAARRGHLTPCSIRTNSPSGSDYHFDLAPVSKDDLPNPVSKKRSKRKKNKHHLTHGDLSPPSPGKTERLSVGAFGKPSKCSTKVHCEDLLASPRSTDSRRCSVPSEGPTRAPSPGPYIKPMGFSSGNDKCQRLVRKRESKTE